MHREGGVPRRVPLSGPKHPGLQAPRGCRGEVRRKAESASGTGQTCRTELWAEETGGGGEQEEQSRRRKHAQVRFRT